MNNDLISRSEAIAAVERREPLLVGDKLISTDSFKNFLRNRPAVDAVPMDFHERCLQLEIQKRFAAEKAAPKWISVQDRLPEDCVNVLVYAIGNNENDVVAMTSYTHNMYGYNIEGWHSPWQYFFCEYKITHWMPLPEPPKMDGDTNGQ